MKSKKDKPQRKWCLPATCEMCKRTCTNFWGSIADFWACDGHYIIMNQNKESHFLPKDENGELVPEPARAWALKYKEGVDWLKANPAPDEVPVCKECGEEARCQDKDEFFCLDHWPIKDD